MHPIRVVAQRANELLAIKFNDKKHEDVEWTHVVGLRYMIEIVAKEKDVGAKKEKSIGWSVEECVKSFHWNDVK